MVFQDFVQHEIAVRCSLSPAEVLALRPGDILLPEEHGLHEQPQHVVIGLGVRAGTKAKRAQTSILHQSDSAHLIHWIRVILHHCSSDETVFGYSYGTYHRLLSAAQLELGLEGGYTPHSPRAGFATELKASGV